MADVNYSTESYCATCDMYFPTVEARADHVENSPNHPRCDTCDRRFLNRNTLRNHYIYSRNHHYCASCHRSFATAAGLRMHIEYASVHRDDGDDEDECEDELPEGWEDEMGQLKFPDEVKDVEDEDDNSWEHYDDCDFEDEEDLGDFAVTDMTFGVNDEFLDDTSEPTHSDDESRVPQFTCPTCKTIPETICSTPCGHLFCTPCIRREYQHTESCPVCHTAGTVKQLRKIYLSL